MPPIPDELPSLGELFARASYRAVHFGKQHDGGGLRGFEIEPTRELQVESAPAYPVTYDTRQDRYTTTKVVEFLERHGVAPVLGCAVGARRYRGGGRVLVRAARDGFLRKKSKPQLR